MYRLEKSKYFPPQMDQLTKKSSCDCMFSSYHCLWADSRSCCHFFMQHHIAHRRMVKNECEARIFPMNIHCCARFPKVLSIVSKCWKLRFWFFSQRNWRRKTATLNAQKQLNIKCWIVKLVCNDLANLWPFQMHTSTPTSIHRNERMSKQTHTHGRTDGRTTNTADGRSGNRARLLQTRKIDKIVR